MKELDELFYVLEEKKKLEAKENELKEEIKQKMIDSNQSKLESEYLKVYYIPESVSKSFDTTAFKNKEKELYEELFKDYNKIVSRKAYVKVTVV